MSLARPWFLLLLLLPLAWWWWRRNRRPPATRYSDLRLINLVKETDWLARVPMACRLLAFTSWVVAAAGPRMGGAQVEMKKEGIAIVIAVDISSSMLAEDFSPSNRMEVAKQQAAAFIKGRSADRIGLVAFSGEALTQVPITVDYPVLEQAVASLRIGMLEDGTAIGTGLATSVNRLREAPGKSKVILLLTDGENNRGTVDPRTAAAAASALGIRVYTIGVGTEGEAPVPTGRG
ncbi:MAG TPA: VWA domain-containing protein, partial [Gemmatimonadales bacterium]|nr:VWA domain-containing protein [Gemmatimonadales bacterium]